MALKCGIVGITNIGKTTIFNCMSNTKAQASNFAFSATKSNIGVVEVPDPRLYEINKLIQSARVVPATVEIVDIPGLTKGSSHGEGVGNMFLNDIQQTNAIIHVLRCFNDPELPHVEGSVDPVRDLEIVDLELQVKDLEMVERKIERTEKVAKSGDKEAKKVLEILDKYKSHFENLQSARTIDLSEDQKKAVEDMFLLTDKQVLYVCNVDDAAAVEGNHYVEDVKNAVTEDMGEVIVVAGKLEAEIAELDDLDDRREFLEDAGLTEPGVNRLVRAAYHLLDLQSFFTAGPKEVRAWTIRRGMNAREAAGAIHSDMERGFIRAEVMKYEDFVALKSEQAVKEAGKFHIEGKNYIVQDGDMLHIRFNV
jgi:hypothetical protein